LLLWFSWELLISVAMQFVPSHCGLEKNERVDLAAGRARQEWQPHQHEAEISLEMVRAKVRMESTASWRRALSQTTLRYRICCGSKPTRLWDCGSRGGLLTRADMVKLARLRTGESYEVGLFPVRLGLRPDARYRWCGEHALLFGVCMAPRIAELRDHMELQVGENLQEATAGILVLILIEMTCMLSSLTMSIILYIHLIIIIILII
jgi:hypothetical protein